jgi:hypothetical protein
VVRLIIDSEQNRITATNPSACFTVGIRITQKKRSDRKIRIVHAEPRP